MLLQKPIERRLPLIETEGFKNNQNSNGFGGKNSNINVVFNNNSNNINSSNSNSNKNNMNNINQVNNMNNNNNINNNNNSNNSTKNSSKNPNFRSLRRNNNHTRTGSGKPTNVNNVENQNRVAGALRPQSPLSDIPLASPRSPKNIQKHFAIGNRPNLGNQAQSSIRSSNGYK